jgi:hypothetical protein
MVEIAKAILADARVLVLNEPTAVLDENRVSVLLATIERLRSKGPGIVFISHGLEEIFCIADKVTVLRDGRVTGSAKVAQVDQNWLVGKMIGRSFAAHLPHARTVRQPALSIKGLSVPGRGDITLTVSEGEIVGLAVTAGFRLQGGEHRDPPGMIKAGLRRPDRDVSGLPRNGDRSVGQRQDRCERELLIEGEQLRAGLMRDGKLVLSPR